MWELLIPPAGENRFPPDVERTSGHLEAPITMSRVPHRLRWGTGVQLRDRPMSARSPSAPGYSAESVPQPKGWGTRAERQKEHGAQGPLADGDEPNCLPDCQLCAAGGTEAYGPSGSASAEESFFGKSCFPFRHSLAPVTLDLPRPIRVEVTSVS